MIRRTFITATLAMCSAARGQIYAWDATVTYTMAWQDNGNHNSLLEPGESALIRLTTTVTPAINTQIQYMNNGTPRIGTLRGLASSFLDINSENTLGGSIGDQRIDPAWDLTGTLPDVTGTNQANLQFGQFPPGNDGIMTTNPLLDVYAFTWTPSAYQSRVSMFVAAPGITAGLPSAVYILTGPTTRVVASTLSRWHGVFIPVVPSPGSAWILLAAAVLAHRSRGSAWDRGVVL